MRGEMSKIQLYHSVDARSFRVLWALEALTVPYDLHVLAFPPRFADPSYLEVNPLGTIPFFIDGETHMTESPAICHYLAEKYGKGLSVAMNEPDYGRYFNFLHFGETTLTVPQTMILRYSKLEPLDRQSPQIVEDYTRWFFARLKGLQTGLKGRTYLCANRFTAADISVGYALMLAEIIGISDKFSPEITAYYEKLKQEPSYLKAKAVQVPYGKGLIFS
jgi:glutathione S-transferase